MLILPKIVIIILSFLLTCIKSFEQINVENRCDLTINSPQFWAIFKTFFININNPRIIILKHGNVHKEINGFVDNFSKQLYNNCDNFLVDIEEESLAMDENRKKSVYHTEGGVVIIVWNETVLSEFLHKKPTIIIPKSRYSYMILLLSCHGNLNEILQQLWLQHTVINLTALCPCDSNLMYSYYPFERINSTNWGGMRSYPIEKIVENPELIRNFFDNFNGSSLKTSIFTRSPTMLRELPKLLQDNRIYCDLNRTKGYGGVDGNILSELSKFYNFNVDILESNRFGAVYANGTITNSLKDIVTKQAEFSANGRFIVNYDTNDIEFTSPYTTDSLCLIVRKAKLIPRWKQLFRCFSTAAWIAIVLTLMVCSLFWWWLRRSNTNTAFLRSLREIFGYLLGFPIRYQPHNHQFFFITTCLLFNIIISGIIQGYLFKAFTTNSFYPDINTLEEFYQSGLPISTSFTIFDKDTTEIMLKLRQRIINDHRTHEDIAYKGNTATIERLHDIKIFIELFYTDLDGKPLLHIVNECLTSYFIAFIVPNGSPFLRLFNKIIVRLVEAGLTNKWYEDVVESMILEKNMRIWRYNNNNRNNNRNNSDKQPFNLHSIQIAFYIFILGHIIAMSVFLCELLVKKFCYKTR